MLRFLIIAASIVASPATASPGDDASISAARAAVAEMQKLAQTPEERALAEQDHLFVEKAAALVAERAAARKQRGKAQEVEMSFTMQYLSLQEKMQHENRSYTAVSNIMKTKHDTVKNSISNIR